MITLETAVAFAIRNPVVMDHLGEALRSDVVVANPFLRTIVEFADGFMLERGKLPMQGDWEAWLFGLEEGMARDGTKEALGRLFAVDVSQYDPTFFSEQMIPELQRAATQVAVARLNAMTTPEPAALELLAEKVANVRSGTLKGLARLSDVDAWIHPVREDALIGTGFPSLNNLIGGWGEELWLLFADSGVGKSILLQNFAVNAAVRGKNVLHITLELGIRPQIHRYYRQIAEASRAEFARDEPEMRRRLQHFFRLAKGSVQLLEFPAYSLDTTMLRRTVERAERLMGSVDMIVLDYLDLMSPTKKGAGRDAYADLGYVTHEIRALCNPFAATVLSATQAVRKPANASRLTTRDMGDSYNKVRGADGLLSLVQTPEEEEAHQGRLGLLKVRDSGGRGQEIALYINRELAVIQELSHPNTVRLMRRLGHLPTQPPARNVAVSAGATP